MRVASIQTRRTGSQKILRFWVGFEREKTLGNVVETDAHSLWARRKSDRQADNEIAEPDRDPKERRGNKKSADVNRCAWAKRQLAPGRLGKKGRFELTDVNELR